MFDVTRLHTFEAVQQYKADLDNKIRLPNGKPIPAILLANKVRGRGRERERETERDRDRDRDRVCLFSLSPLLIV